MKKDLMEWAREICNSLMDKNDATYLYNIRISLKPNLLNFDGCDEVKMEIVQTNQRKFILSEKETIVHSTNYCFNVDEAMEKLSKLIK